MAHDLDKTSEIMGGIEEEDVSSGVTVTGTAKKKKTTITRTQYSTLKTERDNLAAKIDELKIEIAELLEANERLKDELSEAPSIEDLRAAQESALKSQESLLLIEKELAAQKLLMEEKSLELKKLQSIQTASSDELTAIERLLGSLRDENRQLNLDFAFKEQDLEGLRDQLELLRTEAQSLRDQLNVRELPESEVITANEGLKRDLAQIKSQFEDAAKEAQRQLEEATRVNELLKSDLGAQAEQNTLLKTANAEQISQLSFQQMRVDGLEREAKSIRAGIARLQSENFKLRESEVTKDVSQPSETQFEVTSLSKETSSIDLYSLALLTELKKKQAKVEHAMQNLLSRKTSDGDATPNDLAIDEIIGYLQNGLRSDNAQTYFDDNKEGLKEAVYKLRGSLSILNTAVNAILTVLAVCSVVGITALWLTGTLQKNMDKNGSVFAFTMFGAKQLAECDIYQATQEMGVKLGG